MRRFDSSLLKIQKVFEQQRQLAELEVLRAMQAVNRGQLALEKSEDRLRESRDHVINAMAGPVSIAVLLGAQGAVTVAAESVATSQQQLEKCKATVETVKEEYLRLQRKTESIGKLVEQQRLDYQKVVLKQQQLEIDDSFLFRQFSTECESIEVKHHG